MSTRLRNNLKTLTCGQRNWSLVTTCVAQSDGVFSIGQVMDADPSVAEIPYVVCALEWLVELGQVVEIEQGAVRHQDRVFRRVDT